MKVTLSLPLCRLVFGIQQHLIIWCALLHRERERALYHWQVFFISLPNFGREQQGQSEQALSMMQGAHYFLGSGYE